MIRFVEAIRRSLGVARRLPRLPTWVEAIGNQIALRYDLTREPLPDKMDRALEVLEARERAAKAAPKPRPDHETAGT